MLNCYHRVVVQNNEKVTPSHGDFESNAAFNAAIYGNSGNR